MRSRRRSHGGRSRADRRSRAPAGIGNGFDCLGFYRGLEQYLTDQGL